VTLGVVCSAAAAVGHRGDDTLTTAVTPVAAKTFTPNYQKPQQKVPKDDNTHPLAKKRSSLAAQTLSYPQACGIMSAQPRVPISTAKSRT